MDGVLFVDDELFALEFLKSRLEGVKFDCYFANSGAEALEELDNHGNIRIVVTDLNMDNMDGFELLKIVKGKFPSIKRIVLSAHKGPFMIKKAIEDGDIDEFIPKPTDIKEYLVPLLNSILETCY